MKICLWCQTGTEFYKSVSQPCKECHKFTLKVSHLFNRAKRLASQRERRTKKKLSTVLTA